MFGFIDMFGTYESRAVDRYENGGVLVDTCRVTDGLHPYETAVVHPDYGKMIIVEAYDSEATAKTGHARWVKIMTSKKLPKELVDCKNSEISRMISTPIIQKRKARKAKETA